MMLNWGYLSLRPCRTGEPPQAFRDEATAAASVKKKARAAKKAAADDTAGASSQADKGPGAALRKARAFAGELKPAYWQVRLSSYPRRPHSCVP